MEMNSDRILTRLEELYRSGAQPDGTHSRMAYSPEDIKGRTLFQEYFKQLGMKTFMDAAGNLIARMEGRDPSLAAIMVGSHLDTVPDGGKYDGALGCVCGLEVCETLLANKITLQHPLEIVVFTDEEGFRFGSGLLGSSAICGKDLLINEADMDMDGKSRAEVMKAYGITVKDVAEAKREKNSIHCFLELHVEQGASLYKSNTPIGLVSSIAGVSRYELQITGEANHAGSTVMGDRKDALVAAAKFIAGIPDIVKKYGNTYSVATVGTMKVVPNSVNVIPGSCLFQLEIRDQDEAVIKCIEEKLYEQFKKVCAEIEGAGSFERFSYHEPAPMSEKVKSAIEKSVQKLGYSYEVIPSGAFHDSLIMTSVFPTGMIFVPSEKGLSHSRYEYTEQSDIEQGAKVLYQTILEVDNMDLSCS